MIWLNNYQIRFKIILLCFTRGIFVTPYFQNDKCAFQFPEWQIRLRRSINGLFWSTFVILWVKWYFTSGPFYSVVYICEISTKFRILNTHIDPFKEQIFCILLRRVVDPDWFNTDQIRIRIQHFCSIRIRKNRTFTDNFFSHFFEIKIWVKSIQKYRCYSSIFVSKSTVVSPIFYRYIFIGKIFLKLTKTCIFPLKFLNFLAPGSGFPIRIRIHKVTESGSNPDPDPQPCFNVVKVHKF
jgi:hypothetical protein